MIRYAERDDIPAIIEMGAEFYATTNYAEFADYAPESIEGLAIMLIETGVLLVAESEGKLVGMAGLVIAPFLFNHSLHSAHEVMWWVSPESRSTGAGIALLRAIEPACREAGAVMIQMIHLSNSPPAAAAAYERAGYIHTESSYSKVL